VPYHFRDVMLARQLLVAGGFAEGFELVNLMPEGESDQVAYARAVAEQLRDIGVRIRHRILPYKEYLEAARLARTDPEGAGWHINMHAGNRYNDISGYLHEYHTASPLNIGGWGSRELDEKIEATDRMAGQRERVLAVRQINQLIGEAAWTPGLVLPVHMEAWNAEVEHVAVGPEPFQGMRSFIDASLRQRPP
jgi:ABC-type transport system substrate-binding protein